MKNAHNVASLVSSLLHSTTIRCTPFGGYRRGGKTVLHLYEIEHEPTVKDWIIANSEQEAIGMLEEFNY